MYLVNLLPIQVRNLPLKNLYTTIFLKLQSPRSQVTRVEIVTIHFQPFVNDPDLWYLKKTNSVHILLDSTEDVEILITDDTQTSTKIVGGNSAPRKNAWPWMAVLLYSGEVNCGGILISESHILTAAHCAGGDGASPDQVRLGDYDLRYSDSGEQTFGISWIKLHENYNKEIDEHDIAIIKLSRSVRLVSS